MDPEGHTYERSAIEAALAKNPESPMTRTPLTVSQVQPPAQTRLVSPRHGWLVGWLVM